MRCPSSSSPSGTPMREESVQGRLLHVVRPASPRSGYWSRPRCSALRPASRARAATATSAATWPEPPAAGSIFLEDKGDVVHSVVVRQRHLRRVVVVEDKEAHRSAGDLLAGAAHQVRVVPEGGRLLADRPVSVPGGAVGDL